MTPLCFFSSRRRHTRWPRDWSSDVCSSDLGPAATLRAIPAVVCDRRGPRRPEANPPGVRSSLLMSAAKCPVQERSEERRVGKEGRTEGGAGQQAEQNESYMYLEGNTTGGEM